MKSRNWQKYVFEFLCIFIAVVSAFALSNWNENRNDRKTERKILTEIKNSLGKDIQDFKTNIKGNKLSLRANDVFRDLIENKKVSQDSIAFLYTALFRDYIPIINKSAYESFKSNNLKIITNDSLRLAMISLYDYSYRTIEALEYEVQELKTFDNYFSKVNALLFAFLEFNSNNGNLIAINQPVTLTKNEKKEVLSYLWRIRDNRKFKLSRYDSTINAIERLQKLIESEL